MIQQHCQVKLIQCPNHFEICLIRLHDCHVNVGFRLDVRHGVAHLFEKNSAGRDKVSNLDGKLRQKTVAVSSVRLLEKFIELSTDFLLIVFSNVIQVKDLLPNRVIGKQFNNQIFHILVASCQRLAFFGLE